MRETTPRTFGETRRRIRRDARATTKTNTFAGRYFREYFDTFDNIPRARGNPSIAHDIRHVCLASVVVRAVGVNPSNPSPRRVYVLLLRLAAPVRRREPVRRAFRYFCRRGWGRFEGRATGRTRTRALTERRISVCPFRVGRRQPRRSSCRRRCSASSPRTGSATGRRRWGT